MTKRKKPTKLPVRRKGIRRLDQADVAVVRGGLADDNASDRQPPPAITEVCGYTVAITKTQTVH